MTEERWNELTTFSFFVAVTTIIANLVYGMLGDAAKELPSTSGKILKSMQREYAFVAVFALFMAMSFALAYAHSKNENNRMDRIAGAFLDAFLALSASIVIAMYLANSPAEFIHNLPRALVLFSVAFFMFMFSIYMEEGLKPKLSPKLTLTPWEWEYSAVGISVAVFCIVGLIKGGISRSGVFICYVILLAVILGVVVTSISSLRQLLSQLKQWKNVMFTIVILAMVYFTLTSSSKVSLIPGFLLVFFTKLLVDNIFTEDSQNKVEDMKKTRRKERGKSTLSFMWKRLNMHPAKRTLKKILRIK